MRGAKRKFQKPVAQLGEGKKLAALHLNWPGLRGECVILICYNGVRCYFGEQLPMRVCVFIKSRPVVRTNTWCWVAYHWPSRPYS